MSFTYVFFHAVNLELFFLGQQKKQKIWEPHSIQKLGGGGIPTYPLPHIFRVKSLKFIIQFSFLAK